MIQIFFIFQIPTQNFLINHFMESFIGTLKNCYFQVEDFFLDMTVDIAHEYLFLKTHFPFFFIIQTLLYCIEIRRKNLMISWKKSLLLGFLVCLSGRMLTGWVTLRDSPLLKTPFYIPMFILIWFFVNGSPMDFIFRFFTTKFMSFISQFLIVLIQVREATHGISIGLRSFPASPFGSVLISFLLIGIEAIFWNIISGIKSRYFGIENFLKNILIGIVFLIVTQYNEYFNKFIDCSPETIKIEILGVTEFIMLLNCIIFGIDDSRSIDITLLSYLAKLFKYHGSF